MITKDDISIAVNAAIDSFPSGNLTEAQRTDCYNDILIALKSVDPTKGGPVVKNIVVFE